MLTFHCYPRVRHIKCDEGKPSCLNCRSTGRACAGYTVWNIPLPPVTKNQGHVGTVPLVPILGSPFTTELWTDRERRSFEYFYFSTRQSSSISMALDLSLQFIIQASRFDTAMRSAIVALGSLGESLEVGDMLGSKTNDQSLQHFAQIQFHKALRNLRVLIRDDPHRPAELTVMSCYVFSIFEFHRGDEANSMMHGCSGLNILRQDSRLSQRPDYLGLGFLRTSSFMEAQAKVWFDSTSAHSPGFKPAMLEEFSSFEEAAHSLDTLMANVYQLRQKANTYRFNEYMVPIPPGLAAIRQDLTRQLQRWKTGMGNLLTKHGTGQHRHLSHRVAVMKMNFITTVLIVTISLQYSKKALYRRNESQFREIIALAMSVLSPANGAATFSPEQIFATGEVIESESTPTLPTHRGIIQPLCFTAIKCQNPTVRRQAITLLSSSPWREGKWDSAVMAGIAERDPEQFGEEGYLQGVIKFAACQKDWTGLAKHV